MAIALTEAQRAVIEDIRAALLRGESGGKALSRHDKHVLETINDPRAALLRRGLGIEGKPERGDTAQRQLRLCEVLLLVRDPAKETPIYDPDVSYGGAPSFRDWHRAPQPSPEMPQYQTRWVENEETGEKYLYRGRDWLALHRYTWLRHHVDAGLEECPICKENRIRWACQPGCIDCDLDIAANRLLWNVPANDDHGYKPIHRQHLQEREEW